MKRNKISRPDGVVTERLTVLDYFDIDEITEIINETFYSCDIPEYLSRSICRMSSIKSGANEYDLHLSNQSNGPFNKIYPNSGEQSA